MGFLWFLLVAFEGVLVLAFIGTMLSYLLLRLSGEDTSLFEVIF